MQNEKKRVSLQTLQKLCLISVLTMIIAVAVLPVQVAVAQSGATLLVDPMIIDVIQGDNFTITVNATNVVSLSAWQVSLKYNSSVVNVTALWVPSGLGVFGTATQIIPEPDFGVDVIDGYGYVNYGNSLLGDVVNVTNGILFMANITASIDGDPSIVLATRNNRAHKTQNEYDAFFCQLLDLDQREIIFSAKSGSKARAQFVGVSLATVLPGQLAITGHTPPGDAEYLHAYKGYPVFFNGSSSYGLLALENGTRILSNTAIGQYTWILDDQTTITTNTSTITHTYNKTGTYVVWLTVQNTDTPPVASDPVKLVVVVGLILDTLDWTPFIYGVLALTIAGAVYYTFKETRKYLRTRKERKRRRTQARMTN